MQSGVRRALAPVVLILAATGVGVIQSVPAQPTNQSRTVQPPDLRQSVSSPQNSVRVVRAGGDPSGTEIVDNGNGTKTAHLLLGASSQNLGARDSNGADPVLIDRSGRLESSNRAVPISIASSTADSALMVIGPSGRRITFGEPDYAGIGEGARGAKAIIAGRSGGIDQHEITAVAAARSSTTPADVAFAGAFGPGPASRTV